MTRITWCHHSLARNLSTTKPKASTWERREKALFYLILVCHHVPQSLIVNYSKKDVNFKLTAVRATVHSFCAVVIVPGWKIKTWVNVKNYLQLGQRSDMFTQNSTRIFVAKLNGFPMFDPPSALWSSIVHEEKWLIFCFQVKFSR